jgi:hypothetical protein
LVYFNQKFPDEGMRYPEYNWELLDIHHPIWLWKLNPHRAEQGIGKYSRLTFKPS